MTTPSKQQSKKKPTGLEQTKGTTVSKPMIPNPNRQAPTHVTTTINSNAVVTPVKNQTYVFKKTPRNRKINTGKPRPLNFVLPDFMGTLPFQQQTTLLCALRGVDNTQNKNKEIKTIVKFLRRTVLKSARTMEWEERGVNCEFMGSDIKMERHHITSFMEVIDTLPFHYVSHLTDAANILRFQTELHNTWFWSLLYKTICDELHMNPETEEQLNNRLNDCFD